MDRNQDNFYESDYDHRGMETGASEMAYQPESVQPPYESDDDHTYLMKLLDFLQAALEDGGAVPLIGKRLVNSSMCLDILKDIRGNLPLAIQYADQVMSDRTRILSEAERAAEAKMAAAESRATATLQSMDDRCRELIEEAEDRADNIVKTAETHARGLVDNHNITIAAQNEAREITNGARAEANDRRQAAAAYCEDMHRNTEKALQHALEIVKNHRQQLDEPRRE